MTLVRLGGTDWPKCSELARLRTENRLIKSIQEGKVDADNRVLKGWPGVRTLDIQADFSLRRELARTLMMKLHSNDLEQRRYLYRFFMETLTTLQPEPPESAVQVLTQRLAEHDFETYSSLTFLEFSSEDTTWWLALKDGYSAFEYSEEDIRFEVNECGVRNLATRSHLH